MREKWIYHPFLLAIFPILSLYATNSTTLSPSNLVRPILIALVATALLWALLYAHRRDLHKSALLTTVLLAGFWGWGLFNFLINDVLFDEIHIRHAFIFPVWSALVLIAVWGAYRLGNGALSTTAALNFGAAALLAIPVFHITFAGINPALSSRTVELAHRGGAPPQPAHSPDIYYVILDAYGRADVLAEGGYGFRGGLAETLPKLGFFVGAQSVANYPRTIYSLSSSLNYGYLDDLLSSVPEDQRDRALVVRLIRANSIVKTLRSFGYDFITCSSGFHGTEKLGADQVIGPPVELSEFEVIVWNLTPLEPFNDHGGFGSPYALHRRRIQTCLEALPEIAKNPARTFAFAHIVAPHHPFVFGPDGEELDWGERKFDFRHDWWRDPDSAKQGTLDGNYARGYRDQATFISKLVFEAIERILENSPEPPIIIVQGDHGPNGFPDPQPVETRYPILNAYLLPHGGQAKLYDSISPVNSFRIVLDYYFGAALGLLPDRRYRVDPRGAGIGLSEVD